MILYYIRHGDPIYNPDSLTPKGQKQAEALAKRFGLYGLDRIFTSDSTRAVQTAKPTSFYKNGRLYHADDVPADKSSDEDNTI